MVYYVEAVKLLKYYDKMRDALVSYNRIKSGSFYLFFKKG